MSRTRSVGSCESRRTLAVISESGCRPRPSQVGACLSARRRGLAGPPGPRRPAGGPRAGLSHESLQRLTREEKGNLSDFSAPGFLPAGGSTGSAFKVSSSSALLAPSLVIFASPSLTGGCCSSLPGWCSSANGCYLWLPQCCAGDRDLSNCRGGRAGRVRLRLGRKTRIEKLCAGAVTAVRLSASVKIAGDLP